MIPRLYIGDRNYSSWSLRAWLCLKWAGIAFDEVFVELDQPGYGAEGIVEIKAIAPNGKLPILGLGEIAIWESPAIAEWAAERAGPGGLLPADQIRRARARSLVAEMHAGFVALRRDLPMNLRRRCCAAVLPRETLADIARIDAMWTAQRREFAAEGPFLFGSRGIADAFYLPVATRFRTYDIALSPAAADYRDTLLRDAAFLEWERMVRAEPVRIFSRAPFDAPYPGTDR